MRPILAEGFKLSKVELLLNQPFIYYWSPINHLQGRLNDRPGLLRRGNLLFGAAADVDGIQQRERLILEAEHGFLHPSQRSRGHGLRRTDSAAFRCVCTVLGSLVL